MPQSQSIVFPYHDIAMIVSRNLEGDSVRTCCVRACVCICVCAVVMYCKHGISRGARVPSVCLRHACVRRGKRN